MPSRHTAEASPHHLLASSNILPVAYAMMERRLCTPGEHQRGRRQGGLCRSPGSVIALLRQRGRVTYRTLQRQFQLDDEALEALKVELLEGQRLAIDERETVLV
jgi:hypothetical protein